MSPPPTAFAHALLRHFRAHRRDLPWRETSDPYAIWVSEVMLQQTRVETVIPYWERWLDRFPTLEALAEAGLDDVLREWEGLGYYSRARHLHSAARMVRERYDGVVPTSADELRRLPGVGEYTAGAVASIAYGQATPAVDGNVRRVLARIHDLEAPTAGELRERAGALVPEERPGDFNQALMELGATICTPRNPDCEACPVERWCAARRLGVQEERPRPKARRPVPEETVRTAVLVRTDGALLLTRRPEKGLLGGLWEFPGTGPDEPWPEPLPRLLAAGETSIDLEAVVHTFSHKRVRYEPAMIRMAADAAVVPVEEPAGIAWALPSRLEEYAIPVAQRKILRLALRALEA